MNLSRNYQKTLPNTSQYLWQLSEFEVKIVFAILEKNPKTTWEQVAKNLGISRRALYDWRQSKNIQEPIRKIARDLLLSEISGVYEALVRKAKSGDCSAMKLYFEIVENIDRQKNEEKRSTPNDLQMILDSIHEHEMAKSQNKSKKDEETTCTR